MIKQTPWGPAQTRETLAEGIISYSTASHGGIWLSPERRAVLPPAKNFLKSKEWWEEDCDWAIPFVFFANDIKAYGQVYMFEKNLEAAKKTVEHYHPEFKI